MVFATKSTSPDTMLITPSETLSRLHSLRGKRLLWWAGRCHLRLRQDTSLLIQSAAIQQEEHNMHSNPIKKIALTLAAISTIGLLTACNEPGSQGWCDTMSEKSKSEWTGSDTKTYAAHCVLESTTIGSEAWCDNLNETPKGEWTTEEVAEYAKYCVVSQISQ